MVGELIYGAEYSPLQYRADNHSRVEEMRRRIKSLPFDDDAAEHAGRIRADLAFRGLPIGPNDLLIAAIARSRGMTLVTHNTSEFGRVEGLNLEDWQLATVD